MKDRKTFTSKFITFISKILFIPIYVSNEKVAFKLFHWRTLSHLIIYEGLMSLAFWTVVRSNPLDAGKKRYLILFKEYI